MPSKTKALFALEEKEMPDKIEAETCYAWLLLPSLEMEIWLTEAGTRLAPLNNPETLPTVLWNAIETAAGNGDRTGLVRLRQCLLKWAEEATAALGQIAEEDADNSAAVCFEAVTPSLSFIANALKERGL